MSGIFFWNGQTIGGAGKPAARTARRLFPLPGGAILGQIHYSLDDDVKYTGDLPCREALAREARRYLGAPFKQHGIDPATGIDCAGVVLLSARAVGYPCTGLDEAFASKDNMRQLRGALMNAVARIPVAEAGIGDLLIIGFKPGAGHLSVVTQAKVRPTRIVHALGRSYDRVVEHRLLRPVPPDAAPSSRRAAHRPGLRRLSVPADRGLDGAPSHRRDQVEFIPQFREVCRLVTK